MQNQESLNRSILRLALPAIAANITTPVLGLVDVAITGHFGAAAFIGAIAVGSTVFNLLYWLFGFLRMGTAGLTAQAYGAADRSAQGATLWRSLLIALAAGAFIVAVSHPVCSAILDFMDCDADTRVPAMRYVTILVWGAPAVLGLYTLNGWWLGMQDTRIPLYISIGINVANIALSVGLVYGAGWRIEGVATGTLAAQWLGFVAGLLVTRRHFRPLRPTLREMIRRRDLRRLFGINADIFLRTLCLVAVTVWFTRAGSTQGVTVLAANALLMQFFMFFSYFTDGFAFAGEALAGRFHGAADAQGLRRVVRALLRWGAVIALGFTIVYFLGGETILGLLTDQESVRKLASEYLPWAVGVPLCGTVAFIYDGIFVGLTRTRRMLAAMFAATAVYFGAYALLYPLLGNHGLWLAFILYLAVRSAAMHLARPKFSNFSI